MPVLLLAALAPTLFAAAPAQYRATLAQPFAKPTLVTRGTLWACADVTCTARKSEERAVVLCELVAARAGKLASFETGSTAFDPDELARCNAKAR